MLGAQDLTRGMSVYDSKMLAYVTRMLFLKINSYRYQYNSLYNELQKCSGNIHINNPATQLSTTNQISLEDTIIPLASEEEITKDSDENPMMTPFLEACFSKYHPTVIEDIGKAENPLLLLEAIVWYRPVRMNKTVEPYWVYGTGKNIAEYNIQNAKALGNDHGALMQRLTNEALPLCMVLDKTDETLNILKPDTSGKYIPSQAMK